MLTTNKLAYTEKVPRCARNVLVKSEYIEYKYEYEYMTHKLYEYEDEYFKNIVEYTSTRVPGTSGLMCLHFLRALFVSVSYVNIFSRAVSLEKILGDDTSTYMS